MSKVGQVIGQIPSQHINLSERYGCRAFMTVVTFLHCGIAHRARRFFREDLACTGRIEIYTLAPFPGEWTTCTEFGWYESAFSEDFMGYASREPTSRRDRMATQLIEAAVAGDALGDEQSARFAAIEYR